ncbi:MAG TPA: enolase C-terminal domain-like protein [Mycobacteriales bacterium]|nr:enolase C-terminal domain-like protein [Mycobacteriales bacterium]
MSTISRVDAIAAAVPFRHSFTLGSGAVNSAGMTGPVLFVRVETDDGLVGWGEQRALPSWSYETIETMIATVRHHLAKIAVGLSPFDIALFHERADAALSPSVSNGMPFARAAVDIALHDLAGKLAGIPVHQLLGGRLRSTLPLCSAIGADEPAAMVARARESHEYSAYKVKITGDVAEDSERVHAVAAEVGDKPIWLDANQSYRPSNFLRLLEKLRDVSTVHCAEQPVRSPDWAGLAAIKNRSRLPIAVDEGSFTATDLAKIAGYSAADLVVLKIGKSGGIRLCQQTAHVARAHGIELLGSGLTDCGIAFAAALHFFSTQQLTLPVELNGPELLAELLVDGLRIEAGTATVPDGPGLGITVQESRIRELSLNL